MRLQLNKVWSGRRGSGAPLRRLLSHLRRDRDGATAVVAALAFTGVIGFAGLGSEVGLWYYKHRTMQAAVDSAALGAAQALYVSSAADYVSEARAAVARYGMVDGQGGVSVAVNKPPLSGTYAGNAKAVEVIVQQPQTPLISAAFLSSGPTINARAVALEGAGASGCVLALDAGASAATFGNGTTDVTLTGCSLIVDSNSSSALSLVGGASITAQSASVVGGVSGVSSLHTVDGVRTHAPAVADPYANVMAPSFLGCDHTRFSAKGTVAMSPGVYCQGISINANAIVTMSPGVYFVDQGSFDVTGGATLTGSGVTIVLTSSTATNIATADIHGGAVVNLSAPTSGPTAGIAFFQDRHAVPGVTNDLSGGTTQNIIGALYFPNQKVTFAGGTNTGDGAGCMQIVADEIDFKGNANLAINCSGKGLKAIGGSTAKLVE
ncbi:MAG TPA: pilus assembly protein TadG-related protein [Caldimonas sp.]|jgi:Flp pilus assembly protein TadG|nr:pilus assembly protein TadG-related protein [Caldimonas sp.]